MISLETCHLQLIPSFHSLTSYIHDNHLLSVYKMFNQSCLGLSSIRGKRLKMFVKLAGISLQTYQEILLDLIYLIHVSYFDVVSPTPTPTPMTRKSES